MNNIDYNKIVSFLLPNGVKTKGISNVLKEVLKDFCMLDVDQEEKMILLKSRKRRNNFIMKRRDNSIIILPINFRAYTLLDDFEEIIEMRVNDEDNVVLSSISLTEDKKAIYIAGSNWKNDGENTYTQTIGRMLYVDAASLFQMADRISIEMFVNQYNLKRNAVFCDLYWDMNSYLKTIFVEPKGVYKVQVNDGIFKEDFATLYTKYKNKINELLVPKTM